MAASAAAVSLACILMFMSRHSATTFPSSSSKHLIFFKFIVLGRRDV
jgi:hypothetical protein